MVSCQVSYCPNKLARKAAIAPSNAPAAENPFVETELATQELTTPEPAAETPETPALGIPPAAAANAHLTAVTSALTAHATLLPTVDAAQYSQLLGECQNELQPVGLQESNLVQTLAEIAWRMRRSVALEMAIFAKGRVEFGPQCAKHNPASANPCSTFTLSSPTKSRSEVSNSRKPALAPRR